MRIVYLSGSIIPSPWANSIQVMRMCEAFAGNGHEITLIGKQFKGDRARDAYEYYGVRRDFDLDLIPSTRRRGVGILTLPKLYTRLRRYDPREILIYARDVYGVSLAARMGFRVIYEAHAAPYNHLIHGLEAALFKHPRFLRLVVISEALKTLYTSRFAVGDKVLVCHDAAVVPSRSANESLPWPSCRKTLQIGYTGHLYRGKGMEIMLECARRLPQYDFHVIGGTEADIHHWKRQTSDNLHFHGFIQPSLVQQYRDRCDILLLPCQREVIIPYRRANIGAYMSPLKLFEYMASRKAIVVSDVPVLREVLDETMAVLVSPDKPQAWVDALTRCEDPSYRESLAKNAFNAFVEHHTWEKRAAKVLENVSL